MLVLAPVLAGCDAPPTTSAQDVTDYVRNAGAGAQVRRLDKAAQDYVDKVLKAHAAWQEACAPIATISDSDTLWKLDAKEWRDAAKVSELLKAVLVYRLGTNGPPAGSKRDGEDVPSNLATAKERAKSHSDLFDELRKAIRSVPESLTGETGQLEKRVLQLLEPDLGNIENARRRYTEIATEYYQLLTFLMKNAGGLDSAGKGLTFADAAANDEAKRLWSKLNERFTREREQEIASLGAILADEPELKRLALEEKIALRKAGISSETDRRKLRQLELLVHYYDARFKAAEKRKRKLDQKAKADSADNKQAKSGRARHIDPQVRNITSRFMPVAGPELGVSGCDGVGPVHFRNSNAGTPFSA